MAGAIAEIARYTLAKDFRHINPSDARVILIEGDQRVLSSFPEDLSASALKQLQALGVEVITGAHASNLTEAGLEVKGEFIPCRVKIWAAGNTASSIGKTLGVPVDRVGRVIVNNDLTIPGHPEVQVIGDLAHFEDEEGKLLAGRFPGGDAAGAPRRAQHTRDGGGPEAAALLVLGQGQHGDDWPQQGGGGFEFFAPQRISGVADVALRPCSFPRWLPQPACGRAAVGLGVFHL